MHHQIEKGEQFSRKIVADLRKDLARTIKGGQFAVVANGSFARGEASTESDLDYFLICETDKACKQAASFLPKIKEVLRRHVRKDPAIGGAFGEVETIAGMMVNIGGAKDDNAKTTRRILFLLEGDWLYNEPKFQEYREAVLGRYLRKSITDHQFCRFLLNDLIRYYRTICVDFEHKTQEQGKAWGTRNIKLIFSRKLLYFSGILIAAETWQQTYEEKRRRTLNLLALSPIRRIESICGEHARDSMASYGAFLERMADRKIRTMLERVSSTRRKQPESFRKLKNDGHHFSWMLVKLLKDRYDASHPIHNALVV